MSRNGVDRGRSDGPAFGLRVAGRRALLAAALLLVALPLPAAEAPPDPAELELTPRVRSELARLQESWLDWLAATYQEDLEGTDLALAEMQGMPGWLVHLFGATLLAGRTLHGWGFGSTPQVVPARPLEWHQQIGHGDHEAGGDEAGQVAADHVDQLF